jgi:hypothetical protein
MITTPETSRYSFEIEDEYEWDCDLHSGEEARLDEEEDD